MTDNMMSNEEIISEFNDLFGDSSDNDESNETTPDENQNEESQNDDDHTDEDSTSEEDKDTGESSDDEQQEETKEDKPEDKQKSKAQAQQNYKFAEMRNQLKAQETMLKNLGKAIGLDPNSSVEDISNKVNEVLLKKQSQETGIPEDVLQRLQVLEARDANYQHVERQSKTQSAIADLIEKYSLNQESVDGFVQQLVESGKNPLEVDNVDLEAEYIRLNFQSVVKNAVDEAVKAERERIKSATDHSSSGVGTKPNDGSSDKKINSVKDLDAFFNNVEL